MDRIRELEYLLQKAHEEIEILRRELNEARARDFEMERLRR